MPKKFADDWWVTNALMLFDDMTQGQRPDPHHSGLASLAAGQRADVNSGDWVPAPFTPEEQACVPKDLAAPYPERSS